MPKKVGVDHKKSEHSFVRYCLETTKLSIQDAFYRMFDFSGRTSRPPFWIAFIIFGFCAVYSLACEIWALNWSLGDFEWAVRSAFKGSRYFFLYMLFPLAVRRFHDAGVSTWAAFNPFDVRGHIFGAVTYLFEPSDPEVNKYGEPTSRY